MVKGDVVRASSLARSKLATARYVWKVLVATLLITVLLHVGPDEESPLFPKLGRQGEGVRVDAPADLG